MTEKEFLEDIRKRMQENRTKYTPKERFQRMIERGIIDKDGKIIKNFPNKEGVDDANSDSGDWTNQGL